jgi:hypothetical protein
MKRSTKYVGLDPSLPRLGETVIFQELRNP